MRILNANGLKFLAAALMVIDHVGFIFFPKRLLFRYIGRLSMPLFAFAISEGCRYTKDKTHHFLLIFCLAVICQVVYYLFDNGNLYMCILVTFSVSILVIYAMQFFKKTLFENTTVSKKSLRADFFSARSSERFCSIGYLPSITDFGVVWLLYLRVFLIFTAYLPPTK